MKMTGKKIQMMDAGTALFEMEGGFGTALGQIRAELREFGKVYDEDEDLVLDFSTIWRKRIIRCHLEGAGENGELHRYAAVFKEGSRSTALRGWVHGTMITVLTLILFFPGMAGFGLSAVCSVGIAILAWSWIYPSRSSVATTKKIIAKVSESKF